MQKFQGALTRFIRNEEGATAAEYGLIAALIAAVIITAAKLLGGNLSTLFNNLANKVGSNMNN